MAVKINDLDAFDKMQKVEGRRYSDQGDSYSFSTYLRQWLDCYKPYPEHVTPDMTVSVEGGDGAIYGKEGYHRYIVMGDGELIFNPLFARPEMVEQAREVGFSTGRN